MPGIITLQWKMKIIQNERMSKKESRFRSVGGLSEENIGGKHHQVHSSEHTHYLGIIAVFGHVTIKQALLVAPSSPRFAHL